MIPFVSNWLDARIRRIVREERDAIRIDASALMSHSREFQQQVARAVVEGARRRELTHG